MKANWHSKNFFPTISFDGFFVPMFPIIFCRYSRLFHCFRMVPVFDSRCPTAVWYTLFQGVVAVANLPENLSAHIYIYKQWLDSSILQQKKLFLQLTIFQCWYWVYMYSNIFVFLIFCKYANLNIRFVNYSPEENSSSLKIQIYSFFSFSEYLIWNVLLGNYLPEFFFSSS